MLSSLVFRDKSQEKSTEEESQLDEAIQLMQTLQNVQAFIEFDVDGNILHANDVFLKTMRYELHEIVGKHHKIFMSPEDVNTSDYKNLWSRLRKGEYVYDRCSRVNSKSRGVWLSAHYVPITDEQGKVYKISKFATDVTESYLDAAELKQQVSAIRKSIAVIEFELNGHVITANDNFLAASGYALGEIQGRHHRQFVDPAEHKTKEYLRLWEQLNQGVAISDQFRRIKKSGNTLWLQASYIPVFDSSGKPSKVIKYASDITEQKSLSVSLDQLVKEASGVMCAMAAGDLTKTMKTQHTGEFAVLAHAINGTVEKLKTMIGQMLEHSNELINGSRLLSDLNNSSHDAALQTAEQTEESSATATQISSGVAEVAVSLEKMSEAIHGIAQNSSNAVSVAKKAVALSEEAKINVNHLSNSSNAISEVIKVINSIADQTNLLALNATIEAARAGDAGRGFAVVANEVKELAKETARATEDVSEKIKKIQTDSQVAEQVIGSISNTIEQINTSQVSIANTVDEQRSVSSHISQSLNETAKGNNEIANSAAFTAKVANENLHRVEESQQTTRSLEERSDKLSELAAKFILK